MNSTKGELKGLSIYQLRTMARECGVKAPTMMKKEQLINEILSVKNKEKEPYFSNRGRPSIQKTVYTDDSMAIINEKMERVECVLEECKKEILKILFKK